MSKKETAEEIIAKIHEIFNEYDGEVALRKIREVIYADDEEDDEEPAEKPE
jgi:hypothetical protein